MGKLFEFVLNGLFTSLWILVLAKLRLFPMLAIMMEEEE